MGGRRTAYGEIKFKLEALFFTSFDRKDRGSISPSHTFVHFFKFCEQQFILCVMFLHLDHVSQIRWGRWFGKGGLQARINKL